MGTTGTGSTGAMALKGRLLGKVQCQVDNLCSIPLCPVCASLQLSCRVITIPGTYLKCRR